MNIFDKDGLYFLPLGGAEEVGFNLYVYSVNGKIIIVDAGFGFLNDDFPGMEMGMADAGFLDDYAGDVEAVFITHAHEDHFGAISHIWPKIRCPVYATGFTLGHITARLDEFKINGYEDKLNEVNDGDVIYLDEFEVKFAYLVHSTPQNSALLIKTKYGNVVHATDWRFDDGTIDMLSTNIEALEDFAKQGVDMLVCDSTNVSDEKREKHTEMDVRRFLLELVPQLKNTVVATCFPSNIVRLQSLMMAAEKAGRTPVVAGMSLIRNIRIAKECGYLKNVPNFLEAKAAADIPLDNILYICAGSQGNYRSALARIVNEENKDIILGEGDAIIFSSQIIPGNEQKIERMQETLRLRGVEVITKEDYVVHTSGHGGKDDIRKMYEILKPKILIPVHGEKRYLREHARFAEALGIEQVVNVRNGDVLLLKNAKVETVEKVPTDIIGVDRKQLTSINSQLVKNRKRIMYNGSVFISVVFGSGWSLEDLQISSIDILEEYEWNKLLEEIKEKMLKDIPEHVKILEYNENSIIEYVKSKIRKFILISTGIKPVVFMHYKKL
ncbi:MAG: ribonuclease J [Lactobacillaceae bacterium]|jgi:ribonuclease J|nr:ribonuclease J [Lactobacillaceae bacterium]